MNPHRQRLLVAANKEAKLASRKDAKKKEEATDESKAHGNTKAPPKPKPSKAKQKVRTAGVKKKQDTFYNVARKQFQAMLLAPFEVLFL